VTPIRPQLPNPTPTARPAGDARAAFFQAVKAAGPATGVQTAAPRLATPAPPKPEAPAAAPTRYLRPGSLVDIKV
jgi:hypothetical protein